MAGKFQSLFKTTKPVIAMVHFGALPGAPLHDADGGLAGLLAGVRKDLQALLEAGVDALMFGNENDRPYEFKVDGHTWNAVDPERAKDFMARARAARGE